MKIEKYRVESDSVYEWNNDKKSYIFIGKLNGRSLDEFLVYIDNIEHHYED